MKLYVKASDVPGQSLESYVGLPFDLKNSDVQYKIAQWSADTLIATLKTTRGFKRRKFYVDDLSWSPSKIYFQVVEEKKNDDPSYWPSWEFTANLSYYDGPAEGYEDIESMIKSDIEDFIYYL